MKKTIEEVDNSTNTIEKGFSTLLIDKKMVVGINTYFKNVNFDLIIYCTPPITFLNVVKYIKKRDNAKTYLLLKDIFPQNAIDIGILKKTGIKGLVYKYFKNKEKQLYKISDKIGCMSNENMRYLLRMNSFIDSNKVEVFPNSIEIIDKRIDSLSKNKIRLKYNIPNDKRVFVYGGNLGKPQAINYFIEALSKLINNKDAYFVIVGNGTEKKLVQDFIKKHLPNNIKLFDAMNKIEYDEFVSACDVGLVLLDYRFTIPNFPSRILSYMQAGLPIFAWTDKNTDLKDAINEGKFGWWHESNNINNFIDGINEILSENLTKFSINSFNYLVNNYDIKKYYKKVLF